MIKKTFILIATVILAINLSGCIFLLAGAAGGLGTAVWLEGKLTQDFNKPYDRCVQATKSALASMKLEITKETATPEVTQLMSKYTDGKTIWIDVKKTTEAATRVEIRVGATGDKEAASKILKKISFYL
jgi:hypothetical protein